MPSPITVDFPRLMGSSTPLSNHPPRPYTNAGFTLMARRPRFRCFWKTGYAIAWRMPKPRPLEIAEVSRTQPAGSGSKRSAPKVWIMSFLCRRQEVATRSSTPVIARASRSACSRSFGPCDSSGGSARWITMSACSMACSQLEGSRTSPSVGITAYGSRFLASRLRTRPMTRYPFTTRSRQTARPIAPVAPVTSTVGFRNVLRLATRGRSGGAETLPRERQKCCRQRDLHHVAGKERQESHRKRALWTDEALEPEQSGDQDRDVAEDHRENRSQDAPVPSALRERPAEEGAEHESGEVSARGTDQNVRARGTAREDGQPRASLREIRKRPGRAAPGPQRRADEEHREGLPRHRHRREGKRYRHPRGEGDQKAHRRDEKQRERQRTGPGGDPAPEDGGADGIGHGDDRRSGVSADSALENC